MPYLWMGADRDDVQSDNDVCGEKPIEFYDLSIRYGFIT